MNIMEEVVKMANQEKEEYIAKAIDCLIEVSKVEAKDSGKEWNRRDDITKFNTYAHVWSYIVCHDLVKTLNHENVKIDIFYRISKGLFEQATK